MAAKKLCSSNQHDEVIRGRPRAENFSFEGWVIFLLRSRTWTLEETSFEVSSL